ncbi:MAG: cobalamin B12-binding domain-containing protein [Polyangiaceae bacterium]|nr:cobalamin B12-binding domain-containing protein [Polyangiaceae bacterium]MCE7890690.1 radical SAM protein [Sorangiineae bacterium PRO1]MCL4748831.1 cobalamin-dependent protein [Myxococcales bacterium]
MARPDRPRVLLLWPGGLFSGGANFGVPQMLLLAAAIRQKTDAVVDVVDLDMERAFGAVDLARVVSGGYDLVGVSCYSSYDYLKVMAIAARLRELLPRAWLVTGGYHPSARPEEFTGADSPFDFVVVGDGERPIARLVEALAQGKRPLTRVLGPDSVQEPKELVPYDWSLLERYRPIARKMASQAEIYLSRGCPYDCSFCMERAKRDVSWRALEPLQAVEELHRLDRFLDLSRWTLFVADALFGMKRGWRREFLSELARRPLRARKVWLLIRLDLIEKEDIQLMARANVGPGFGLESGDPGQLKRIRKAGKLEGYLEKMLTVAEWARDHEVAFGANIIVGHPGETEASLRTSAKYMKKLFADHPRGTHGFLSVDPFRLYPGSPIDEERDVWERQTGMRVHRYPWWQDGDQDFLAEWVDPSAELDFRTANRLRFELFSPILESIGKRFAYTGPARDYYLRAVREQIDLCAPRPRLRTLGLYQLWRGLNGEVPAEARRTELANDAELANLALSARRETLDNKGIARDDAVTLALLRVPRERFVLPENVGESADDRALSLGEDGGSTISALHAYAIAFRALGLASGDDFVDLGGGSGYGAALAAEVVGRTGSVLSLELDPALAEQARENLADYPQARVLAADAHALNTWRGARRVYAGFALREMPSVWLDALGEGGVLVAPVGSGSDQRLMRFERRGDGVVRQELGPVRYVPDRSGALAASAE